MKPINIRGIDEELYNQARAEALKKGITIGRWLNEAMALKLGQKKPKK